MNQTVSTGWYARKCALGALIAFAVELALLAAAAGLLLNGAVGEERIGTLALIAAALGTFVGCVFAGAGTSRRKELVALCAALCWLIAQVAGFIMCDGLIPARSLMLACAVLAGTAGALLLCGRGKKRHGKGRRGTRHGRR